jgi:hypothetical protein
MLTNKTMKLFMAVLVSLCAQTGNAQTQHAMTMMNKHYLVSAKAKALLVPTSLNKVSVSSSLLNFIFSNFNK